MKYVITILGLYIFLIIEQSGVLLNLLILIILLIIYIGCDKIHMIELSCATIPLKFNNNRYLANDIISNSNLGNKNIAIKIRL